MTGNIQLITVNGYHWHSVVINGIRYLINRIGKAGDCIRA